MGNNHDDNKTQAANAVLTPMPLSPTTDEDGDIRTDRVATARARLAAGLISLSAEDLADAILGSAARARLCRA